LRLQSLLKWTITLCMASLLLVACGGGDSPAPEDNNTDADNQTESQNADETVVFMPTDAPTVEPTATPTAALPPPTAVPLEVQFGDLPAGQYSLSLVGAMNSDIGFTPFDTGLTGVDYKLGPNGTNLDGPYQVSLWTDILTDGTTDDTTAQIKFTMPASAESGTFNVVGQDAKVNPSDIGVEIETGFGSQRFAASASGTLNILVNSGVAGVFTGEFEVTVGDEAGNTVLATGRASAIQFVPQETAELVLSGAIEDAPTADQLVYSLGVDSSTAANNDWRLDVVTQPTENNPYIIQHRIYMRPNIGAGTYDVTTRVSELDARPEDRDVTAYVELFNANDGTQIIPESVSGTLEVLPLRDSFSATFTLTYTIAEGETVTATAGAYYLFKPAS